MSRRPSWSRSEGEVNSGEEEKAISSTTRHVRDTNINPSTRLHAGSSSRSRHSDGIMALSNDVNFHFRDDSDGMGSTASTKGRYESRRDRSRSRSPYRANKPVSGEKRRHEEDHYSRNGGGSDPRRFKVRYEDGGARGRRPYSDLDKPQWSKGPGQYDDRSSRPYRDRGRDADRDRSRSPFRHKKSPPLSGQPFGFVRAASNREYTHDAPFGWERAKHNKSQTQHTSSSAKSNERAHAPQTDTRGTLSIANSDQNKASAASHDDSDDAQPTETLSEAELIEKRRKRREEIRAKHKTNAPLLVQALEQSMPSAPDTPLHDSSANPSEQHSPPTSMGSPQTPQLGSLPSSPAAFAVESDEELADRRHVEDIDYDEDGPSAADYDPNLDMQEDRPNHKRPELQISDVHNAMLQDSSAKPENQTKRVKDFDMFADDDDNMFAPGDTALGLGTKQARALDESLLDNWDYPDGHYRIILGELLDGRYAVQQQIGKGTFATVVRALDTETGTPVAIKIAANNQTMYKAGQKEIEMVTLLNETDPKDRKHIIRLLRNFDHKAHLCLVFENLSADLREVLKKFGRNVGITSKAIEVYAPQMFSALDHLKESNMLHADLKPDNILVNEKRNLLKICDLGSASFARDAEVTPYLVSRFYRAPEIILGMELDYAIDMWAIGCTLFELYTGRILFQGTDGNQMLRVIQECRGRLPNRLLKRSTLVDKHFDNDGNFFSQERDSLTGKVGLRQLNFSKIAPGKDLRARLAGYTKGMTPEELKKHAAFVDLLDKCLQLDPVRRISPTDAKKHPFFADSTSKPTNDKAVKKVVGAVPRKV